MLQCECQKLAYEKQGQKHGSRKEKCVEALYIKQGFSGTKDKQ